MHEPKSKRKRNAKSSYKPQPTLQSSQLTQEELSNLHFTKYFRMNIDKPVEIEGEYSIKVINPENELIVDPKAGYKCRFCGVLKGNQSEIEKHYHHGK